MVFDGVMPVWYSAFTIKLSLMLGNTIVILNYFFFQIDIKDI